MTTAAEPFVVSIRREFVDGRFEPWRGGAVASWWREYVMAMLGSLPSYCPKVVAVHVRLENGQLATYRPSPQVLARLAEAEAAA